MRNISACGAVIVDNRYTTADTRQIFPAGVARVFKGIGHLRRRRLVCLERFGIAGIAVPAVLTEIQLVNPVFGQRTFECVFVPGQQRNRHICDIVEDAKGIDVIRLTVFLLVKIDVDPIDAVVGSCPGRRIGGYAEVPTDA